MTKLCRMCRTRCVMNLKGNSTLKKCHFNDKKGTCFCWLLDPLVCCNYFCCFKDFSIIAHWTMTCICVNVALILWCTWQSLVTTKNTSNWTFINSHNFKVTTPIYIPPSFGCVERLLSFRLVWCSTEGAIEQFWEKQGCTCCFFLN